MTQIEIWWNAIPMGLQMTDSRARALLEGRVDPKNDAEREFIAGNLGVDIPPMPIKIVATGEKLSLHKPSEVLVNVYGQGDTN